jgi:hypothetical protein
MKTNSWLLGVSLGACLLAVNCGSDGSDDTAAAGAAGSSAGTAGSNNGGTAGSGGTATAGSGGTATAGSGGTAGSSGSGGEAGAPAPLPPANPHAVVVPQAAPTPGTLLAITSDFTSKTELASVTLSSNALQGTVTVSDGDAVVKSSGGMAFLLERTNNKVDLLDAGAIAKTFDLTSTPSGASPTNKAYVAYYSRSMLAVLDLDTGKVTSQIDLSEFDDASDTDGSSDIDSGVYDPTSKIAYFTLGRIDRNTIVAPDYQQGCPSVKGLIVGVDTTTDGVVDLNGAAAGKGIELSLVAPTSLSIDPGKTLTISDSGCYAGTTFGKSGVEVVDLTANTAHVAYASPNSDFISGVIPTGSGQALLDTTDDTYAEHWYQLDLDAGTLGVELLNVPSTVSWDGTHLFGIDATKLDLLSYDPTSGMSTTLLASPWTANLSNATGSALAK